LITFSCLQKITIAIDGYSSCGKSTLAKGLSQKLGYSYIDTGAMYRAVTFFALKSEFLYNDGILNEQKLVELLPQINVAFKYNPALYLAETFLNGENIEKEIRTLKVSDNVSKVSSIKAVREKMVALQRKMGKEKGVVLDGRDIGTNVFPHAELKLFMTADYEVRVQRRIDEYSSKGQYHTKEEVKSNLMMRDHEDTHRKENPLSKAKDAITIDNSDLTKEQQLDFVLKLISDMQLVSQGG
jgi:CMP/dCMP kinase